MSNNFIVEIFRWESECMCALEEYIRSDPVCVQRWSMQSQYKTTSAGERGYLSWRGEVGQGEQKWDIDHNST